MQLSDLVQVGQDFDLVVRQVKFLQVGHSAKQSVASDESGQLLAHDGQCLNL